MVVPGSQTPAGLSPYLTYFADTTVAWSGLQASGIPAADEGGDSLEQWMLHMSVELAGEIGAQLAQLIAADR